MGEQALGFGGGQRDEQGAGRRLLLSRSREVALHSDAEQEGKGEQHESDMTVPAQVAAHLVVIQAKAFAGFEVLFNMPPGSNSLHHHWQGRVEWSPD